MENFYSWINFSTTQAILAIITMSVILSLYIWSIIIDFKNREIEYWKILLVVASNFIIPIPYCIIYGSRCMIPILIIGMIVWFVLSIIQGLINKETKIGQADVDVFLSQVIITICMCILFFKKLEKPIALIVSMTMVQTLLTGFLIGAVGMLIIWGIKTIYNKISKKEPTDNKNIPNLLSFIPAIIINLFVMLAL